MSLLLAVDVGNTNIVMGIFDPSQGPRSPLVGVLAHGHQPGAHLGRVRPLQPGPAGPPGHRGRGHRPRGHLQRGAAPAPGAGRAGCGPTSRPSRCGSSPASRPASRSCWTTPLELGADRIVNAVAGLELYGAPLIAVDFGTATTFDIVNDRGSTWAGSSAPASTSAPRPCSSGPRACPGWRSPNPRGWWARARSRPCSPGLYYGYVGLVDGILARLLEAYPGSRVVATGGLAKVIAPASQYIQDVAVDLTLEGLRILWLKNRKPAPCPHPDPPGPDRFHPGLPGAPPGTGLLRGPGRLPAGGTGPAGQQLGERARAPACGFPPRCRCRPWPPGLVLQRAMGAVAEALEPWGAPLGLKWPNDLVARQGPAWSSWAASSARIEGHGCSWAWA